jgi:hypothetical protein
MPHVALARATDPLSPRRLWPLLAERIDHVELAVDKSAFVDRKQSRGQLSLFYSRQQLKALRALDLSLKSPRDNNKGSGNLGVHLSAFHNVDSLLCFNFTLSRPSTRTLPSILRLPCQAEPAEITLAQFSGGVGLLGVWRNCETSAIGVLPVPWMLGMPLSVLPKVSLSRALPACLQGRSSASLSSLASVLGLLLKMSMPTS